MRGKLSFVIVLVAIWAAIFVASYVMSARIEGPRNLDTGLARLDVLARYQIVAFAVAVVSGVTGVAWRKEGKRLVLVGLIPLLLTTLLVVAIVVGSFVVNNRPAPEGAYQPPKPTAPTAPVDDLPGPVQE